jgi:hypothetical protein
MLIRLSALFSAMLLVPLVAPAAPTACKAVSGPQTVAVLELYTSEGCSSCPPADHQMSILVPSGFTPDRVVPLVFHVDYWDYTGWKDRFARPAYSVRQRDLADVGGARVVYTPQFFLNGKDLRSGESGLKSLTGEINKTPARAEIQLALEAATAEQWNVSGTINVPLAASAKDAAVYLAVYENHLVSEVNRGENQGATLKHDFVVREWLGPLALDASGTLELKRTLQLKPAQKVNDSGIAVIVQNRRTSDVLQALQLPYCGA